MDYTTIIPQLLILISMLTIFVNIITQVAKSTFVFLDTDGRINLFVLGLSVLLTVAVAYAYCQINFIPVTWYLLGAFFIVGILVAYAAMFGYDKLLSYFSSYTQE